MGGSRGAPRQRAASGDVFDSARLRHMSNEVLQGVAARSAPGARAATFTVAGQVRRGLSAAGFEVRRAPGHGRKRERLEAIFPGQGLDPADPGRVAVIGAGIAGASVVRALRRLGVEPVHFEAETPGAGASGNPAGLVTPRLDAGLGPIARLAAQAYLRALDVFPEVPGAVLARGLSAIEDYGVKLAVEGAPSRGDVSAARAMRILSKPVRANRRGMNIHKHE